MNEKTKSIGDKAEEAAANYLKNKGYKILDRNWRRPRAEIDVIARKTMHKGLKFNKVVYFVEVKYRKSDSQGSGLDYITPKKLEQMKFAAKLWVSENRCAGDYELSAVEVTGDMEVTNHIPALT